MLRFALLGACAFALAACATAPPPAPAPERLAFIGTLDLSQPGIGFHIAHESGLACDARYGSGRLPETATVLLSCNDEQSGTLTIVKTPALSGAVVLSGGRSGDVTFEPTPTPRVAVAPPPPAPLPPIAAPGPTIRTGSATVRYSTGYVRAHTRRGGYVRGHYRKGKWVSGHHRRGTTVRGHYRRR